MTFKELISVISKKESIPASQVRKVAEAVIEQIKCSIEKDETLKLRTLVFTTKDVPAREATESSKARPARKQTRVKIRKTKVDAQT